MPSERIVMINDTSVGRGGATGLAVLAAKELVNRGRDVTFLVGDAGENSDLNGSGVNLWGAGGCHITKQGAAHALINGLYNKSGLSALADWIEQNDRPDTVYHVHGWSKIWSPGLFRALRPVQVRLVIHAHDFFLACPNGAFWHYDKRETCELRPLGVRCLKAGCDRRSKAQGLWRAARTGLLRQFLSPQDISPNILLIHPAMKTGFGTSGYADERLKVVRNPVVPFCAMPISASKNKKIAFVGRLNPEKGALVLAKACQKANIPLMVLGEGPEESAVAQTGAEMYGWCDRDTIAKLLKDARLLVMPSQYPEPFGLVAVEALGSGLPVVVPDTALLAHEITSSGAGASVDCTDETALAETLGRLSRNDQSIVEMSQQALVIAPELGLSLSAWLDELEASYAFTLRASQEATR
ncbi:MAG: glycosyltransferase [Paracoccaceae bacterium]